MATNRELFAQALCEALSREYREELADCTESAECSMEHYKKMSKILGFNVVPKSKALSLKKKIVIAILAAALLLTGCTAVIFRNEIRAIIEEICESFIDATYDEDWQGNGSAITEYYKPTYIPSEYKFDNEIKMSVQVFYHYKKSNGDDLRFEQSLINGTGFTFDNESGYTKIIDVEGKEIYHRFLNEYNYYVWNNSEYTFRIILREELSNEELEKIVKGVLKIE